MRNRRSRKTRTNKKSSLVRLALRTAFVSEVASPERRRALCIEPLEERRLLAWDMTLSANASFNVTQASAVGTTTFTASGAGANLNWQDVVNALGGGDNVVISSGSLGAETGNITDQSGAQLLGIPSGLSLTFQSGSGAGLVGDISLIGINLQGSNQSMVIDAHHNVSISPFGQLAAGTTATPAPLANLQITAGGAIGSSGNDITFDADNLATDTSSNNGDQYLKSLSAVSLSTANALNAGSGTITLDGGDI